MRHFLISLILIPTTFATPDITRLNTESVDWASRGPNHVCYCTWVDLVERQEREQAEFEDAQLIPFEETLAGFPLRYWLEHDDPEVRTRALILYAKETQCSLLMNLETGTSRKDCGT